MVRGRIRLRRLGTLALVGSGAVTLLIAVSNLALWLTARNLVVTSTDELEQHLDGSDDRPVVALIPGARVHAGGRMSRPLADRVYAAVEVFESGLVDHLLVSGDNRTGHYDEPTVMRREAHLGGVPLADISVDYAGLDTWDTCRRANKIFGAERVVFVTQERYANRSASLCQAAGLETVVLAIPNPPSHPRAVWLRAIVREPLAAVKGLYEVLVKPEPRFLGPFEGLDGSVDPANPDAVLGEQ